MVGYADVQVNLKDINDNAPIFPQGVYFGNVTENGTAGMVVMTMTAVDYDDPNEGKCSNQDNDTLCLSSMYRLLNTLYVYEQVRTPS